MSNLTRFLLRRPAVRVYEWGRKALDKTATAAFASATGLAGMNCKIPHPFYLKNPQYFHIGSGFHAGPGLRLEAWDEFHGQQFTPEIVIGDSVGVNFNVHIGAIGRIEIHDNVLIGSNVLITDHAHGNLSLAEREIPPAVRPLVSKGPVVIEDNVWIGEGVCILAGVRIGRSAVIGCNAVVTHDVAPGEVVGGVPARPIQRSKV